MLALDDSYEVLQVDPKAEREVIRAAHRTLALKYHPDVSAGSLSPPGIARPTVATHEAPLG
jgi:curved DNA-binding protein CbpA